MDHKIKGNRMFNLKKFLVMGIFCMMFFVATAHAHHERSKGVFKLKDLKGWFIVQGITAGFAPQIVRQILF